ncbi:hypothetical protein NLI96_g5076 [Meripilus lineatus]|uniref:Uncharacterized protein n=1 Tax=Meripilus lineatus TaxID=2056292 RepID=A0AAD5V3N5_9APHY|nr:hypothetical protein NLI96_g5076 [Physisporinus lineatus]
MSLSTLRTLRIGGPFHNIIGPPLLGLFPSLKGLHLEGPAINECVGVDLASPVVPIRIFQLQALSILGCTNEWGQRIVDDLVAAGCINSLRTLDLRVDPKFSLLNLCGLFRAVGGSLRELSLNMKYGSGIVFCASIITGSLLMRQKGDGNIRWGEMNLHLCTSLQTLKFSRENVRFPWDHDLRTHFEDILRVIKTLGQSPIRDVAVCVAGERTSGLQTHIKESHWQEMQSLLLSMRTIRSLTFLDDISEWDPALHTDDALIPGSSWVPLPEEVEDVFASHLPSLVEEGIFKHASRGEWS